MALGFVALAMIGLQFAITARFRHVAAPYGIDILLRFHRQVSLLAVALVLAHPVILFATRPGAVSLLNVAAAPWRARFALTALPSPSSPSSPSPSGASACTCATSTGASPTASWRSSP